ncbi:MAG: GntR family transcriptional regulator [Hyphomicrobiales bacterium]|nr:GntR family transcriptional regulator [Hyphomicrobiales bacterium]
MRSQTPKPRNGANGPNVPPASAPSTVFATRVDDRLPDVLGQELTNIIEKRIIFLDFMPGVRVTEQEISKEFGISRSPVREAFRQLESSGLVVRLARRGIRVNEMTQKNLNEIYSCRAPLEGLAAAAAAKHATEDDLHRMKASLEGMAAALDQSGINRFFDNNILFQQYMHDACGNSVLKRILADLHKHALRYRYFGHKKAAEMPKFSYERQKDLFEAIEARDAQKAKRLATNMMRDAQRLIGEVLKEHGHELTGEG